MTRETKARRAKVHVLNDKERAAIEAARRSGLVSDADMADFWKRHGIEAEGRSPG